MNDSPAARIDSPQRTLGRMARFERRSTIGLTTIVALAALFLAVEMIWYTGIIQRLGELQFGRISRYFPDFTVALIVALISLIIIVVLRVIRPKRDEGIVAPPLAGIELRLRTLGAIFLILGSLSMMAAAAGSLLLLWPNQADAGDRVIDVGSDAAAFPEDGPATLTGAVDYRLTAQLRERRLIFFERHQAYVPMTGERATGGQYAYFIAVPFSKAGPRQAHVKASGYLKRGALPPEIAQLYKDRGRGVTDNAYVLLGSKAQADWRPWFNVAELAIFGSVNLLFGFLQRRHAKKLRQRSREEVLAAA